MQLEDLLLGKSSNASTVGSGIETDRGVLRPTIAN
jgi:hypothetical protein